MINPKLILRFTLTDIFRQIPNFSEGSQHAQLHLWIVGKVYDGLYHIYSRSSIQDLHREETRFGHNKIYYFDTNVKTTLHNKIQPIIIPDGRLSLPLPPNNSR